ncbi:MAG: RNA polymerase sigma factor [Prevotella sp.]
MDASVFKQRFVPCSRTMYWTAFRLTGHAAEAEDLVQEVYLKLWTQRDRLPRMDSEEAYCVRMVRNVFLDRRRSARLPLSGEPIADRSAVADDDVAAHTELCDLAARAKALMDRLPEQQRTVMMLKDVDDCTYEEVAERTGLTPGNLRVVLSRARKTIRRLLGE